MQTMFSLTKRNIKMFFKDKAMFFFFSACAVDFACIVYHVSCKRIS